MQPQRRGTRPLWWSLSWQILTPLGQPLAQSLRQQDAGPDSSMYTGTYLKYTAYAGQAQQVHTTPAVSEEALEQVVPAAIRAIATGWSGMARTDAFLACIPIVDAMHGPSYVWSSTFAICFIVPEPT